eukprot:gene22511-biopygen13280
MPKVRRNVPNALRACATVLRTVTKQWRMLGEKSARIRNMGNGQGIDNTRRGSRRGWRGGS